jgi:hypothetical protein
MTNLYHFGSDIPRFVYLFVEFCRNKTSIKVMMVTFQKSKSRVQ